MKTNIAIIGAALLMLGAQGSPADEISPEAQSAAQHAAVTTCATCHGPQGRSVVPKFPTLAGQHRAYLAAQLKAFKGGDRGADKEGRDPQGRIMWAVAQKMSDEQMKAVADYTAGLR